MRVPWRHVFGSVQLSSAYCGDVFFVAVASPCMFCGSTAYNPWLLGSDLGGVRPLSARPQRPHVFVCAGSVAYIPATVQLPVLTCVLCILCILTVSKLQFRHRAARLRTHGFRLGFRWCSAFSHPLPTTSCFCLYTFGCSYTTCYGPLTCLDLCTVYFHGFEAAVSAP